MQAHGDRSTRLAQRTGAVIERWSPSWHASLMKLAGKIEGAPASRAFGEWALINKILAPDEPGR